PGIRGRFCSKNRSRARRASSTVNIIAPSAARAQPPRAPGSPALAPLAGLAELVEADLRIGEQPPRCRTVAGVERGLHLPHGLDRRLVPRPVAGGTRSRPRRA